MYPSTVLGVLLILLLLVLLLPLVPLLLLLLLLLPGGDITMQGYCIARILCCCRLHT